MSTSLMKKISGRLTDLAGTALNQISFGVSIELTTSSGTTSPGGWIGSAPVKVADATFELFTAYDIAEAEEVSFRILNGNEPVKSGTILINNYSLAVPVTPDEYKMLNQTDVTGYTVVKGSVTLGDAGIAAVPLPSSVIKVFVNKEKFRAADRLSEGTIDIYGNYEIKVPNRLLQTKATSCSDSTGAKVFVTMVYFTGNPLAPEVQIARSVTIEIADCCAAADLHIDKPDYFPYFYTELDHLLYVMAQKSIPQSDLPTVIVDEDTDEVSDLAASAGLESTKVASLVRATIMAQDWGVIWAKTYALVCWGYQDVFTAASLDADDISLAIDEAIARHQIPHTEDWADLVEAIKDKRGDIAGEQLTDNGDRIADVLATILGSATDAQTFLRLSTAEEGLTPELLWQRAAANSPAGIGAVQAAKLQKGMQLLAVTGMSPEMSDALVREIPGQPVSSLAILTKEQWETRINAVKAANPARPCIPKAILDEYSGTAAVSVYADRIKAAISDLFATSVINHKLDKEAAFRLSVTSPDLIRSFLNERPAYDFRIDNVWDITGAQADQIRTAMMPLQNLVRLTEGEPDAVAALSIANYHSSAAIAEMSEEDFVAQFASSFNGGEERARATYQRALHNVQLHTEAKVAMSTSNYVTDVFPMTTPDEQHGMQALAAPPATTPDVRTLFGNLELCNCSECTSMYSPGAYFTDIMNFIKKKLGNNPSVPYQQLTRRRPDLPYIDLTCKNANTPVPYVDLVNERLEAIILNALGFDVPESFQTSGTAKELEAYPEHTYRNPATQKYEPYPHYKYVYEATLRNVIYPNNLPFHLPVEESRTYLKQLGASRYDLMHQFRPKNYSDDGSVNLNEYSALAEWLKITRAEAEIITDSTNDAAFYYGMPIGGTWYDTLCTGETGEGLGTLLHRSRISYLEMLQLLTCDFVNPKVDVLVDIGGGQTELQRHGSFVIKAIDGAAADTCDTTKLKLFYKRLDDVQNPATAQEAVAAQKALWNKWHRFLRLQRATGWSFYQLDIVLKSFGADGASDLSGVIPEKDLNVKVFKCVAKTHQLATLLRARPEHICTLWSSMNNTRYINFSSDSQQALPSVYDSLFRNKAVLNPPNNNFSEDGPVSGLNFGDNQSTIIAAMGISDEELIAILSLGYGDFSTAVTFETLSPVYGFVTLFKGLKIPLPEAVRLWKLFNTFIVDVNDPDYHHIAFTVIEDLLGKLSRLKKIAFSLDEITYLVAYEGAEKIYTPADEDIRDFYTKMRFDLQQLGLTPFPDNATADEVEVLRARLRAVIDQYFALEFNLEGESATELLEHIKIAPGGAAVALALQDFDFIASAGNPQDPNNPPVPIIPANGVPAFSFERLYEVYRSMHKAAMIINKLKLSHVELDTLLDVSDRLEVTALDLMNFSNTVTPAEAAAALMAFVRLNEWVMVRDRLNAPADQFATLLRISAGGSTDTLWKAQLFRISYWEVSEIESLMAMLQVTYDPLVIADNDCRNAAMVLQFADILASCKLIGINPQLVLQALTPDVSMDAARNIRMAAKARYSDDEWAKVAKPLQDVLRERQRQSLVAFITGTPNIINVSGTASYRNEKELYEFLLMDVEMKPCMKTSRIRLAISSVQQFMDRIILSLEYVNGNPASLITLSPDKVAQWESWRKWYRVWEANRKVFLYPENWIEPELRDDKTPFFREMETQLLQDEIKSETAGRAFMDYLEMLDEVSRLEPVGAYHQAEPASATEEAVDILHVVARTYGEPHRYFYRKLENNEWSPWEKMNVDAKTNHIVPMVWNRRLYLFWITFKTKKPANNTANASPDTWVNKMLSAGIVKDTDNDRTGIVEATLNWSEFKDNKWQATQSCKEVVEIDLDRIRISAAAQGTYTQQASSDFAVQFAANSEMKLDELFINRLNFYVGHIEYNPERELVLLLQFAYGLDELAIGLRGFIWEDSNKEPYVLRDPDNDSGHTVVAPQGSRFDKTKLVQYKNQKLSMNTSYNTPNPNVPGWNANYFIYLKNVFAKMMTRGNSSVMLSRIPYGPYRITKKTNNLTGDAVFQERNPLLDHFFFEDNKHTFFVRKETGTYSVQKQVLLQYQSVNSIALPVADLIAKVNYTPSARVLNPELAVKYQTIYTTGSLYRFHTFYHTKINDYIKSLNKKGLPGLLNMQNQRQDDGLQFATSYLPNGSWIHGNHPTDKVQFGFDEAYGIYNWELFFHAPMLIAQRLSDNQQFDEARKWYHYIFDPTSNKDGFSNQYTADKKRFWKFYPFYKEAQQTITTLSQLLQQIHSNVTGAIAQVDKREKNPFKPHVIARIRVLAYMKNVFMKYLDNLIAWADQLFRRDTMEAINEATQLYILAANLLGKKPEEVPARATPGTENFFTLDDAGLDALSNAMVAIESYFAPNDGPLPKTNSKDRPEGPMMFYFCLPKNDKLLAYWATVADRLFKIRNCMNIDGAARELALYEPPIDPALLVRAAAKGLNVNTVLNSISGNALSPYRFAYVLQKANEFTNDVKSLGGSLLSALEKKDAEQLALLRSGQELQLLEKVKTIKEIQVREAEANLAAVRKTRENTELRRQYYSTRPFMNGGESQHLQSLQTGMVLQSVQSGLMTASSAMSILPQFHAQAMFAIGASFGGQQIAAALNAISTGIGIAAAINNGRGSMALTRAGYERRMDDWQFQTSTAAKELEQLDQQILASEIRLDIARRELSNHELQMANTAETDAFMRSKFSNVELYSWMSNQIATTYFLSYQLAFDLAKKAEACFDMELPGYVKPASGFIGFAYWDSLRRGLQSGEKLQFDLRKMESAYMDGNKRELELTKNISLALTDPKALLDLRASGKCDIFVPEELFDMDYPGHYLRRIKSVSISLPCIAGPYTTIPATLTLLESRIRKAPGEDVMADGYAAKPSIATSGAQNDSGVFELNFRDERYLPFENRGAISKWELHLADEEQVRLFDFETISDVILQVRYTARDGGNTLVGNETFRTSRINAINELLYTPSANPGLDALILPRYFSLRHEFSKEWYAAFQSKDDVNGELVGRKLNLQLLRSQFPAYAKGKAIEITGIDFYLKTEQPIPALPATVYWLEGYPDPIASATIKHKAYDVSISFDPDEDSRDFSFTLYKEIDGDLELVKPEELSDLYLVMSYKLIG
jgi:hypothetical protein